MKPWLKPSRLQFLTFIYSMPAVDLLANYILYDSRLFSDYRIWLFSFPLIFVLGALSWRGHVLMGNWIKHRYPTLQQTTLRILIICLVLIPFMSLTILCILFVYDVFGIFGYSISMKDLRQGLFLGFSINLIFETLYEAEYVLERYKESLEEKNQIRQMSVHQEYDTLKSQVNPHFLFNCFNTLSSLISEDKMKAELFLNEMSKVYRYLLHNNQSELSTVENEVRFIGSYFNLLQMRHGEAVQLHVDIDRRYQQYLLPSLSLQLLVENVVKHNVLSRNRPLVIDIFTTAGNRLVVNNNLQKRTVKAPSNRVGLENIRMKYHLLQQEGFRILEDEKNFTVVLPLIWNQLTEGHAAMLMQAK